MLRSIGAAGNPAMNHRPCHPGFVTKGTTRAKETVWSKLSAYFERHLYIGYVCCFVGMPIAICTAVSLVTAFVYLIMMAFSLIL